MVSEANVLVIDDEQTVCHSCERILSEKGYRVRTALNGEEGLKHIEKDPFDLVIVDLRMPGTDGIGVLRKVRERHPGTLVIVITGLKIRADPGRNRGVASCTFRYCAQSSSGAHFHGLRVNEVHERLPIHLWPLRSR